MAVKKDFFSIIIVNFNGKKYLENCLTSVLRNNYRDYEVVIVDNGSVDGSVDYIKNKFSSDLDRIKILTLEKNYGPSRARNEGVKIAKGKYLGFLDNDTQVTKNWIIEALKCFRKDKKIAAIQCKLLFFSERKKIDYVGEYLGTLGFLISVADHGETDKGQYDSIGEILAAKSAGMFIRKDVFEKLGGFDEDYFIFMEETDLGWRCWLAGYEVVFCPRSIVYHHFSATKDIVDKKFNNYLVRFHGTKNYILTLYKNLSLRYLVRILPPHVFLWFCLSFYLFLTGNMDSALNIGKGIFWNLINLKKNSHKRELVQKKRVLSDEKLFIGLGLMKKKNLFYFIKRFTKAQKEIVTTENQ